MDISNYIKEWAKIISESSEDTLYVDESIKGFNFSSFNENFFQKLIKEDNFWCNTDGANIKIEGVGPSDEYPDMMIYITFPNPHFNQNYLYCRGVYVKKGHKINYVSDTLQGTELLEDYPRISEDDVRHIINGGLMTAVSEKVSTITNGWKESNIKKLYDKLNSIDENVSIKVYNESIEDRIKKYKERFKEYSDYYDTHERTGD